MCTHTEARRSRAWHARHQPSRWNSPNHNRNRSPTRRCRHPRSVRPGVNELRRTRPDHPENFTIHLTLNGGCDPSQCEQDSPLHPLISTFCTGIDRFNPARDALANFVDLPRSGGMAANVSIRPRVACRVRCRVGAMRNPRNATDCEAPAGWPAATGRRAESTRSARN